MSKHNRWMPLDVGSYAADTLHLTTLQHGAYLLLLMHYWKSGPLPDDDSQLASIAKMDPKAWRSIRGVIRKFFTAVDGALRQKRADIERDKTTRISDERSTAGRNGAEARWKQNDSKLPDKTDGKQIANAKQNGDNHIANERQLPDVCHDFATTPVPSQRSLKSSSEGKEAAGARETEANSIVRGVTNSLKTKPPPFTPSREAQLSALTIVRDEPRPQEPIRTVEEQLAILRGEATL